MPGRFIGQSVQGTTELKRAGRRSGGSNVGVTADELQDPNRLAAIISDLQRRVVELEGKSQANFIDFQKRVTSGDTVYLDHHFGSPVRFSVVKWQGSNAADFRERTSAPMSTNNVLVLTATCTGTAIIRVEQAQWQG